MKVYQVYKPFFDGDHEHGSYRSPLFATRELAEEFKRKVWDELKEWDNSRWETDCFGNEDYPPSIIELEVEASLPPEEKIKNANNWLTITYT